MRPLTMTAQAVLLWLAAPARKDGHQPPEDVLPRLQRSSVHEELLDAQLIRNSGRVGVPYPFFISDKGRERAHRLAPAYRRKHMEYRLLQAVQGGGLRSSSDLPTSDADNPTYSPHELRPATKKMRAGGFLTKYGTSQSDLLRTTLTPLGEAVLESDYAPDDYIIAAQGGSVTNHINITNSPAAAVSTGAGNASSTGNTVSVSIQQDQQLEAIDAFLTALRETTPQPGAEDEYVVMESVAEELRGRVESGVLDGAQEAVKGLFSTAIKASAYALLPHLNVLSQAVGLG